MNSTSPQSENKTRSLNVKADTRISNEGDPAGAWYILLSGKVGVFKGNLKITEFDKKGAVFGEISSILSQPRTATLVALQDCELLCIDANLDQLVRDHPDIARKIIYNLAERLVKTTDALWMAVDHDAHRNGGAPKA